MGSISAVAPSRSTRLVRRNSVLLVASAAAVAVASAANVAASAAAVVVVAAAAAAATVAVVVVAAVATNQPFAFANYTFKAEPKWLRLFLALARCLALGRVDSSRS